MGLFRVGALLVVRSMLGVMRATQSTPIAVNIAAFAASPSVKHIYKNRKDCQNRSYSTNCETRSYSKNCLRCDLWVIGKKK